MDNIDWRQLIALLIALLMTSSSLYLIAYWSHFDIPIFEYISVNDIIKTNIITRTKLN